MARRSLPRIDHQHPHLLAYICRLLWRQELKHGVLCACLVGRALWLGCDDGHVRVLLAYGGASGGSSGSRTPAGPDGGGGGGGGGDSAAHRSWHAHVFPVVSLAAVGTTVYSLAEDGAVRGWPASPPLQPFVAAWQVHCQSGARCDVIMIADPPAAPPPPPRCPGPRQSVCATMQMG